MSRIGRKPIPLPAGVKIAMQGGNIDVQGPKGKLSLAIPRGISFEQKDGVLTALRETEDHRALHGLARALVANAVHGVTQGFKKDLDIVGVGYRAELKGKMVAFALGKSHPIEFHIPEGIQVAVEKQTHIVDQRRGQGPGWTGCRRHALAASAGSVQAEGHPHYRRALEEEGRQSGQPRLAALEILSLSGRNAPRRRNSGIG